MGQRGSNKLADGFYFVPIPYKKAVVDEFIFIHFIQKTKFRLTSFRPRPILDPTSFCVEQVL